MADCTENSSATSDSECELEVPEAINSKLGKKATRFSVAQQACLNAFYNGGLTGCGKEHFALIEQAAKDTKLSVAQVKVVIEGVLVHYVGA